MKQNRHKINNWFIHYEYLENKTKYICDDKGIKILFSKYNPCEFSVSEEDQVSHDKYYHAHYGEYSHRFDDHSPHLIITKNGEGHIFRDILCST